jgi:uncharacterized protein YdaU (DUF1376 family)
MVDKVRRVDYSPAEFLEGVSNLTVEEIGLFWVACSMMYAREESIANDAKWIGRAAGCSARKARSLIDALIAKKKLSIDGGGKLTNARAMAVISTTLRIIETARKGGERRSKVPRNRRETHRLWRDSNGLDVANHQPSTINQESKTHTHARASRWISPDWEPSEGTIAELRKLRPDLSDARFEKRRRDFKRWLKTQQIDEADAAQTWIDFMRTTFVRADPNARKMNL